MQTSKLLVYLKFSIWLKFIKYMCIYIFYNLSRLWGNFCLQKLVGTCQTVGWYSTDELTERNSTKIKTAEIILQFIQVMGDIHLMVHMLTIHSNVINFWPWKFPVRSAKRHRGPAAYGSKMPASIMKVLHLESEWGPFRKMGLGGTGVKWSYNQRPSNRPSSI